MLNRKPNYSLRFHCCFDKDNNHRNILLLAVNIKLLHHLVMFMEAGTQSPDERSGTIVVPAAEGD